MWRKQSWKAFSHPVDELPASAGALELPSIRSTTEDGSGIQVKGIGEGQTFFLYSGDPLLDPPVWRFQGTSVLELADLGMEVLTDPLAWFRIVHQEDRLSLQQARKRLAAGHTIHI